MAKWFRGFHGFWTAENDDGRCARCGRALKSNVSRRLLWCVECRVGTIEALRKSKEKAPQVSPAVEVVESDPQVSRRLKA